MRRLLVLPIVLLAGSAHAEGWDRFPELPAKESLAISSSLDSAAWAATRTCLRKTWPSGATYYAAVVDVTDAAGSHAPTASDAVPWVDALYREWKPGGRLDPEKHVLVALGLANHSVAIHPGSRWTELGFKTTTIKTTIDGSGFGKLARAGDYPQAVCTLVEAVDAKLVALAAEETRTIARLKKDAESASARATVALPKLRALGLTGSWASTEVEKLEKVSEKLEGVSKQLADGKVSAASDAVSAATNVVQLAEDAIDRIGRERAMLATARTDIQKVLAQIDASPAREFGPMRSARSRVDRCARDVEQGEAALHAYDPWVAVGAPNICLDLARPLVSQAESQWRFRTRTLPFVALGLALSAAGLYVAMRRRARSLVGTLAHDLLETWSTTVERSAERLLALERDHALYFSAARPRWTGTSEPLDRRVADAVNRVFLLQSAATDLLSRAQEEIDRAGWLSVKPFENASRLLTSEAVRFETGEVETRRRVDLPLMRSYEGAASTVLGDLSRAYSEAFEALEAANASVERAAKIADETVAATDAAVDATTARGKLGLPAAHLADAVRPLLERRAEVQEMLARDPVGAADKLAEVRDGLRSLGDRARMGNDVVVALESLGERASELRKRAEALRGEGLTLAEPGLSVEERLERATRRAKEARVHVANGEEADGAKVLEVVRRSIEDLERDLERTVAARAGVPRAVERLRASARSIAERAPAARATLERIAAEHDPEAFRAESGNVDALGKLLPESEAEAAAALVDHGAQRFLSAASRVDAATERMRRAEALLEAIACIDETLAKARTETRARLGTLDETRERLSNLLEEKGVSTTLAKSVAATMADFESTRVRTEASRPHWVALDRASRDLESRLGAHEREVRAAIEAHVRTKGAAEALDRRLRVLAHDVAVEQRDRPHVAEAVSVARARLDGFLKTLASDGCDGVALEREFPAQVSTVDWVAEVFRTELSAIEQAERELAAARQKIARVQWRSFGEGVQANVASAQAQLATAEGAVARRDWGAVLAGAEAARSAAEEQERICAQQARALQEARLAEAARSNESSSWSSSTSSDSSWSSSSSTDSSGSSSSSSDSGSSSWSSSSDSGGSSWSSSDSGGSSW